MALGKLRLHGGYNSAAERNMKYGDHGQEERESDESD